MQFIEATDVSGSDESASGRPLSRRALASAVLAAGVLAAVAALVIRLAPGSGTVPMALLALPPVALLLGAGLWWSARGAVEPREPDPQAVDDGVAGPDQDAAMSPRVRAAYVATLEATLAEQDERLHECRRAGDLRVEEQLRTHRDRVRLTVLAMRDIVGDETGAVALNRVERALDRLHDAPAGVRPLLAAQPSGRPAVSFAAPSGPVVVEHPAAAVLAPPEPEAPVAEPRKQRAGTTMLEEIFHLDNAAADGQLDEETPLASTPPPEMRRVLPVPARPVVETGGRRTRRRLRRRAAVSSH